MCMTKGCQCSCNNCCSDCEKKGKCSPNETECKHMRKEATGKDERNNNKQSWEKK